MSLILLDSPVASGVLANLLDRGNQAEKSESWILTVSDLLKKAPDGSKVTIPTPVYYELAARNPQWYCIIETWKREDMSNLFYYLDHSLTQEILRTASLYRLLCGGGKDDKLNKRMWPDSLIAAYCLQYDHWLITSNLDDFDRRYFEVKDFLNAPSNQTIYLLAPLKDNWIREKNRISKK